MLAIDITLAVLTLAVLGYCGWLIYQISEFPDAASMQADISQLQGEISQLETDIDQKNRDVAQAEEESQAEMEQAQEALTLVQAEYDTVSLEHEGLKTQADAIENGPVLQEQLKEDIARIRTEYGQAVRKLEDMILAGESDYRICYLTFDDGPSYLTPNFLDRIDELDIYVTFFTIGVQMQKADYSLRDELMRREALSGHSLANHTYTHAFYGSMYRDINVFVKAVQDQDDLVYSVTGVKPDVFRFPAGSYYCPFRTQAIEKLNEMGYGHIDWIGNAYDSGDTKSSAYVSSNVVWQARQDKVTVILMHDWRSETLAALRTIVETLKAENYLFLPLFKESSLIGTATPKWG